LADAPHPEKLRTMSATSSTAIAQRAATLSLVSTTVVVAVKLLAAYRSGSISVLAEAIQSIVDILMSAIAVATIRYAAKPPDESHPYGHGKAEVLASAFQMLVILGSGIYILYEAYQRLLHPRPIEWNWGAWAMAYALLANLLVAWHLKRVAKQTSSTALESEALHLRGDSLSSGGVFVGMLLVGLTGEPILDPAVAAIFTAIAMLAALSQLRSVIHPLMDGALPAEELRSVEEVLNGHDAVRGYHNVRTRSIGAQRWIDLHVMLDDGLTFVKAHDMAEQIEKELGVALGGATVTIHYEPHVAEVEHRAREHGDAIPDK
jgi:cation diffusion facilitator family transporter